MEIAAFGGRPDPESYRTVQDGAAIKEDQYALNLCAVYEDDQTRQWAREVCTRVQVLLGEDSIRATWTNLRAWCRPAALQRAVANAIQSDVIVVAIRATSEPPLAFYDWAEAWVSLRYREPSALLALIGLPEEAHGEPGRIREYLRTLSCHGGLGFMVEERRLPPTSFNSETRLLRSMVMATPAVLRTRTNETPAPGLGRRRVSAQLG